MYEIRWVDEGVAYNRDKSDVYEKDLEFLDGGWISVLYSDYTIVTYPSHTIEFIITSL